MSHSHPSRFGAHWLHEPEEGRVAPLALAHRRRRQPFDDPGMAPDEIDQALEQATGDTGPQDALAQPDEAPERIARLEAPRATAPGASGRRSMVEGRGGALSAAGSPAALCNRWPSARRSGPLPPGEQRTTRAARRCR